MIVRNTAEESTRGRRSSCLTQWQLTSRQPQISIRSFFGFIGMVLIFQNVHQFSFLIGTRKAFTSANIFSTFTSFKEYVWYDTRNEIFEQQEDPEEDKKMENVSSDNVTSIATTNTQQTQQNEVATFALNIEEAVLPRAFQPWPKSLSLRIGVKK